MASDIVSDDACMTISEILKDLEFYTERFPRRAMQQAIEQREAITPHLLGVLEEAAAGAQAFAQRKDYMLHLFAMHLLAQFRDIRAYSPLIKMFSAPGEVPFDLAGDTVTEGLSRILGSVYDGDPAPLQRLVQADCANEYVRSAAIDTFIVLVRSGQMDIGEVVTYYRNLFQGKLRRIPCHVWNGLVCAVADLPAPALLDDVRQSYADGLADKGFADLQGIERDLLNPGQRIHTNYALITDAIAEMQWWACFQPQRVTRPTTSQLVAPSPAASLQRKFNVGRNDPCPCGSGKKHKKCCGRN